MVTAMNSCGNEELEQLSKPVTIKMSPEGGTERKFYNLRCRVPLVQSVKINDEQEDCKLSNVGEYKTDFDEEKTADKKDYPPPEKRRRISAEHWQICKQSKCDIDEYQTQKNEEVDGSIENLPGNAGKSTDPDQHKSPDHQNADGSQSEYQHVTSEPEASSKITVLATSNKGTRKYDKKQYCPYCLTGQSKLPRHLETHHSQEPEVVELLGLPKACVKRQLHLLRLRNLGNYRHNNQVLKHEKGELVVVYRPERCASWKDYLPCEHCLGFYCRGDLYRHVAQCKLKAGAKVKYQKVQRRSRLLVNAPCSTRTVLQEVLARMSTDQVFLASKGDALIMRYGQKLCQNYSYNAEQQQFISRRIRDLGRLLCELRKTYGCSRQLSGFINPKYFKPICHAVRTIANFDECSSSFGAPSVTKRVVEAVIGAALTLQSDGIKNRENAAVEGAGGLLRCFDECWEEEIGLYTSQTKDQRKRHGFHLSSTYVEDWEEYM